MPKIFGFLVMYCKLFGFLVMYCKMFVVLVMYCKMFGFLVMYSSSGNNSWDLNIAHILYLCYIIPQLSPTGGTDHYR